MDRVSAAIPVGTTPPGPKTPPPATPPPIAAPISIATGSAKAKKSPHCIPGGLITVGLLLFKGSLKIRSPVLGSILTL